MSEPAPGLVFAPELRRCHGAGPLPPPPRAGVWCGTPGPPALLSRGPMASASPPLTQSRLAPTPEAAHLT